MLSLSLTPHALRRMPWRLDKPLNGPMLAYAAWRRVTAPHCLARPPHETDGERKAVEPARDMVEKEDAAAPR